jgi:thiamine kinase
MRLDETTLISGSGATADVYAYGEGRVLKLFRQRAPHQANEALAARVAADAGLPTPRVLSDGLIEVDDREGIIFDRVDGMTMHQHVEENPDDAEASGRALAELHTRIHACEGSGLHGLRWTLARSVAGAQALDESTQDAVVALLYSLPVGNAICHNDLHPLNVLRTEDGWSIIDWAAGLQGASLACHARSWLLAQYWTRVLGFASVPTWRRFWAAYEQAYQELTPVPLDELRAWKTVIVAVSIAWDKSVPDPETRAAFVEASLAGGSHPWLDE